MRVSRNSRNTGNRGTLISEFCTHTDAKQRFTILHKSMLNAFPEMTNRKVDIKSTINLLYQQLNNRIEERLEEFDIKILERFHKKISRKDEISIFASCGLTFVNVILKEEFILEAHQESFLSIIENYCNNIDNIKKVENYFIHTSKKVYTIDKMKRSLNDLGKESRQFIIDFDYDLTRMEDTLSLVNLEEVLRFVENRERILLKEQHLVEGTKWLPEFQRRIKALITARKTLGNLEEPIRVSKERTKELREHWKKHFANLPKYEELEEIKDWDW